MRFQQLNRDPNSIMRKKLVKSKKNWIVVSSLSFAGGLLLLGGPAEIVHAADTTVAPTEQVATPTSSDSKTDATKTDSTKSADVTKAVAPVTTEENTDSTVQSDTVAPVEKETATTEKTDATDTNAVSETLNKETTTPDIKETRTTSEAQPVVAKDAQTIAESENTEVPVSNTDVKDTQTTTEDVKNIDGEKVDTPVPDSDIATDETTDTTQSDVNKENVIQNDGAQDDILAANLAVSKAQLASLGISAEDLTLTPEAEVLADGNIAEGTQGTTPWKIDADGVLHLGTAGETTSLADNTATTTQHTSTGSSQIDSSSTETKESPTSPWMKHANDITRINFEGDVNAASDMSYMFADLNKLTTITNANKLHTVVSNVSMTKTVGMFANDTNLKEISSDSTTNETKPTINLSSWNFASVTDANSMFLNDSSIEYVTFSEYKESTLKSNTNFNYMFKNNTSLITAYMPQLQFRRTKSMIGMFQNDRSLTALDISSWNMANSSSIDTGDSSKGEGMFDGTDSLTSLTLSSINRFSSYTALSSKNGSSWIEEGGKSIMSDPSKADNSTTFNLNSIVSNLGSGILNPTEFKTDGNVPADIEANLIIPSNLGDIETSISGPIYSSQDVKVPTKDGYTANVSTITANILNDKAVTNYYVTYTPVASNPGQKVTFTAPDGQSKTLNIPDGVYGTDGSITIPDFDGYTHTNTTVTVIYGPDGVAIVNTTDIYSPVKSKSGQTVTFTAPNGQSRTIDIPEGAYGTDGSITVPNIDGYTHDEEVPVSYDKDGNAIVNTDKIYTPIHFDATTTTVKTPEGNKTITIPEGNYGDDPKTVDVPSVTGYISAPLTVTYNADGTTSINTPSSLYTPVHSNGGTAKFTTPDGQTQTVNIPAGDFGTNGNISIPDFEGYTHEDKTIPVIYDANGNAIVKTDGLYTPIHFDPTTTTVKTPEGNKTVTIPEGNYGDNPKTVDVPSITGYTSNPLTVTYNADGTTSIDTPNKLYMPVHSDGDKATFITPNGDTTVDIPAGDFSKKDVTIDVPQVTGYNTNVDKVPVTYNADGSASADTKVIYTPVHSDGGTATIKTPDGPVTIDIPEGDYSKSNVTTVNVPKVHGYTTSTDTLKVTYDANGNATINTSDVSYTGVENKSTSINLKNPDGKVTSLDIPAGRFGDDPVTITAQNISGYTAPSIIVTFGADGIPTIVDAKTPDKEISTSDTLTYSRIPSSHTIIQKDTEKTDIATPKQNSQNVATYSEKGQILLYTLGEDNKMTAISNYGLAKQSTWYSDEQITVDGIQYLRVATNKWVKASQVYSYQDLNQYVRTYDKTAKVLYKSEDEVINNRILQPNTSWFSDRTTYVINGDKYYRVATNEFVSAKDAYIYQPTNMVVKTHTDSPSKNLYTAKGELITNRSLVADSNWLVDSIVYIEGIKYYRVATNEFVKASDVDINH